jgi:hypothetical protein
VVNKISLLEIQPYIGGLGYTYQDLLNSAALQTNALGRYTPVAELVKSD